MTVDTGKDKTIAKLQMTVDILSDVERENNELRKRLAGKDKTIAKLQRSNERQAREIIALMNKGWRLDHEIRKLEQALLDCFMNPKYVREIVRRKCPRAVNRLPKRFLDV